MCQMQTSGLETLPKHISDDELINYQTIRSESLNVGVLKNRYCTAIKITVAAKPTSNPFKSNRLDGA